MGDIVFPELPEGRRWTIGRDILDGRELRLQERRTWFGLMYWKTIAREHINPFMKHQQAIDYAVRNILRGSKRREEINSLVKRHRMAEKRLAEILPLGPVSSKTTHQED